MLRWAALAGALALCACGSTMGPTSITASRTFYNEVIHDTASEQLLLNIIRAKNYETPNFVDVSEADATVAFTGSVTGTSSGIGAKAGTSGGTLAGNIGAVGGTFSYGDQALVRYSPVLGYPLIQQISSPIAPVSIVHMFDSDYPLGSILEMSVERLTPGYADYYLASDRMVLLDQYGSIVLTPQKTAPGRTKSRGKDPPGSGGGGDAENSQDLNIILQNQAPAPTSGFIPNCEIPAADQNPASNVRRLWAGLENLYGRSATADVITLQGGTSGAGFFFRTRSAVGSLKLSETPEIYITSPEEANEIISYNNQAPCHIVAGEYVQNLFYFNSQLPGPSGENEPNAEAIENDWKAFFTEALQTRIDARLRNDTVARDSRRVFILIERTSLPPSNAYVAISRGGYWYSIRLDDRTSKNNFALLNEILTIQASPEKSPQLTPSISVGGR
jgi:hypothetical protein